ncbi:aldo/keto reductase [Cryptosporangium phraense]|uniref:Aldo/keto reductase n=1 Tax=Cryptosporangium phraense TaxID=2593070 RepID=A0A545ATT4_9ACTN|nr:aldo/keto reductase [Cryptosporangium phraense]TQS44749.1 aldo/keto reductase [Cryptosporangium phraense]
MDTRTLWSDGPAVGAIGLGCMGMSWAYGTDPNSDDPAAVIGRAVTLGMTLIDTSDVYGPFTNEELVGKALAGRRDEVTLATKGGLLANFHDDGTPDPTRIPYPDGRPEHMREAIDGSLRRLAVEHIDLYYLHRPDPKIPVEESIGVLADAVRAGKIRAIGVSEFSVEQLDRAQAVHPISAVQSEASLWTRDHLSTTLPWCEAHGAGFVPFSPLGRGFLTGAYRAAAFAPDDFRARNPRFRPENATANLAIVDAVEAIAATYDATAAQVALAWVLAQGEHVVPIPGTRRVARLEENAGAAGLTLSPADLAALDALPAPAGARY